MISIRQIEQAYPERLRGFKRNILREYLQYKILEIIFNSGLAHRLSFLGGTALRIVHENNRFSEDLDFDNFKLSENDFMRLTKEIQNGLQKEGYDVEIRAVMKSAFRCYVKLPQVLFDNAKTIGDSVGNGRDRSLPSFDHHAYTLAAAAADRFQGEAGVAPLHFIKQRGQAHRSRGADGVPQRDARTVDIDLRVHLLVGKSRQTGVRQTLHGKRLLDFN